jgi:hypothetical protein
VPPIGSCSRIDSGRVDSIVANHCSNDFFRDSSGEPLCSNDDSFMRASVLSNVLPKLELRGIGGSGRSGGVGQSSAAPKFKNSEAESQSLVFVDRRSVAGKPGLDCAVCARETNGNDESPGLSAGVGGQRGFVGSRIGVEMLGRVSTDVPREERDEGPLALIDSVSLVVHENDREGRVGCAFLSGERGGLAPLRWRGSMSPNADLKMRATSLSAIVGWSRGGRVEGSGFYGGVMLCRQQETVSYSRSMSRSLCAAPGERREAHVEGRVRCAVYHSPTVAAIAECTGHTIDHSERPMTFAGRRR